VIVLALDTSTALTSVALLRDGVVLAERDHLDARRHAEVLLPLIDAVVQESGLGRRDVTHVAVGVGPGAYTGLRVGVATATALGLGLGVAVHPVPTLDAMAAASGLTGPFGVVTDARRKELYWARYDVAEAAGASVLGSGSPGVGRPKEVAAALAGLPVVGAAATPFAAQFDDVREPSLPRASWVARLAAGAIGAGDAAGPVRPLYLRRPDVTLPAPAGRPVTASPSGSSADGRPA